MYLLATDFDRTFYINNNDFKINLGKANKFMKENIFVIATGRAYEDFMNMTKGAVKSNYLILNHGATILKDDEIIVEYPIEDELIQKLKEVIDFENLNYFTAQARNSRLDINAKNINKINISFTDNLIAKKAVEYINNNFNDKLKAYALFHKNQIEIISSKVDKSNAVEYIRNLEGISVEDVYTVGDGYTDVRMIKQYNGYAMQNSVEELINIAIKTVKSVSEIFDYLDVKVEYLNDKKTIIKFINECFDYKNYFEKYMVKIYGENYEVENKHLAIVKNNDIVALGLLAPNEIIVGNKKLNVLTIGSICVNKKYRKQGYFHLLMNKINKVLKSYDLGVLSGEYSRYNKYGYYPNILNLFKVKVKDNNIIFKKMDGVLNKECLKLYNQNNIHAIRDEQLFKEISTQWKAEAYYVYKDNMFLGYLIYNTKLDYVSEFNVKDEIEVLESFAHFKKLKYINVRILNNDYEKLNKFNSYENNKMYNRELFKINNLRKVLKIFMEYKNKYYKLEQGVLKLKIDDDIFKIVVEDKVSIENDTQYDLELTYDQAMNIFLNKKISNNKLLNSWFYIDLDMYNNDLV